MKLKTCYACDEPATEDEHVPPRCIFPEGSEHRKNLIKVPSCVEHNSKKSGDDEYLKFVLTCAGGMNALAADVFGSVVRSFDYRPGLIDRFMPDLQRVRGGGLETAGFKLDMDRFQRGIAFIVRGLYLHHKGEKLTAEITGAAWELMLAEDYSKALFFEVIRRAEEKCPVECHGANARIFQYGFGTSATGEVSFCRLRFYEGHPIYVTWKNSARDDNSPAL